MYYLYSILCLLLVQTKATSAGNAAASAADSATGTTGAAGGAQTPPSFFDSMIYFLPAMLAMMLVYMLFMKPPAKGGRAGDLPELKKNDRVVTAGGIVGTVIKNDPDSDTTTLRVDDSGNTKMQFLTSSIVKVLSDEKDKEKASSDKK
ncbi:preprotein translocase subunit YajC [Mariniblastus fucicola]|uniref:Sec translocon accessory complex subunit YajC n=1 Tax=Mariniblastus fucicola TaxID=980251 RepID=A0A5B9PGC1_9BACT|nr:preprotein translocase subunit YajC [Mariniblastus fucicola]QEG23646.1 preprotein translocase subunit YajC [Mariniblastus fucicola]